MSLIIFLLAACVVAGAALALRRVDRNLGKALRFEIPPWMP
jgi:hypothetical protein